MLDAASVGAVGVQGCMYKASPPFGPFENRLDALAELKRQMAVLEELADDNGRSKQARQTWQRWREHHRLMISSAGRVCVGDRPVPDGLGEVDGRCHALRHRRLPRADPAQPLRMVRRRRTRRPADGGVKVAPADLLLCHAAAVCLVACLLPIGRTRRCSVSRDKLRSSREPQLFLYVLPLWTVWWVCCPRQARS